MSLYEDDVEAYIQQLYEMTLAISSTFAVVLVVYYLALIRVKIN
jgi:hypothetical protein